MNNQFTNLQLVSWCNNSGWSWKCPKIIKRRKLFGEKQRINTSRLFSFVKVSFNESSFSHLLNFNLKRKNTLFRCFQKYQMITDNSNTVICFAYFCKKIFFSVETASTPTQAKHNLIFKIRKPNLLIQKGNTSKQILYLSRNSIVHYLVQKGNMAQTFLTSKLITQN